MVNEPRFNSGGGGTFCLVLDLAEILPGLAEFAPHRHALRVSDADLREQEHRFCATGSVEDEAAWLRERVRVGRLELGRLRLAAGLRHEAALRARQEGHARPGRAPTSRAEVESFVSSFCEELDDQPWEVHCRVALAARRYSDSLANQGPKADYLHAAEAFVLCPCDEHEALAAESSVHLVRVIAGRSFMARELVHSWELQRAVAQIATSRGRWGQACDEVLEAVANEVVPWALGYSDPVRERLT